MDSEYYPNPKEFNPSRWNVSWVYILFIFTQVRLTSIYLHF